MAEDTAVAEAEVAEDSTPAVPDERYEVDIGGEMIPLVETTHKKGKTKGQMAIFVEVTDLDNPNPAVLEKVKRAVGISNYNKAIMRYVIRPACNDATHDALKDGEVSDIDWAAAFRNQFLDATRKSGTGIRELKEKRDALLVDLNPLILKQAHGETLSQADQNRLLSLLADYGDLNDKIEKKGRMGKKAKKTTEPAEKKAA